MTSKPDFKVMVLLLVFMQLTRDLFAIAKFLLYVCRVVEVKGRDTAQKAIEILHRYETHGRYLIFREVSGS